MAALMETNSYSGAPLTENAVWERPTMSRRDGGGVAVSTATESQRKGSTPPGIDYG